MSTRAQKSANSANAQLSTGPRTEEGKQKASRNSAKHYMTAKQLIVPGEDPHEYDRTPPRPRTILESRQRTRVPASRTDSPKRLAAHASPPPRSRNVRIPDAQPRASSHNAGGNQTPSHQNHEQAMARAFVQKQGLRQPPPLHHAHRARLSQRHRRAHKTTETKEKSRKLGPFRKMPLRPSARPLRKRQFPSISHRRAPLWIIIRFPEPPHFRTMVKFKVS